MGTLVLETEKEAGAGVLGWGTGSAQGAGSVLCRVQSRAGIPQQNLTPVVGIKVNSFPGLMAVRSVGVG